MHGGYSQWVHGENMRRGFQAFVVAAIVSLMAFCVGCASMAERGLLADVKKRIQPAVNLGPEIILLEEVTLADDSYFTSLIGNDGHAHLFAIDKEKRVRHVEISGNEVHIREILGVMDGLGLNSKLDVIEHPSGKLRVVAGDKMFIRTEDGKWQEIKGNRCQRFIAVGDDLLCAFIAKGEDMGAPMRRDWTVGWFIVIPVVFWSDVHAEKLVLAQETKDGWAIRAVFDPETKLSARSDFMAGIDRRGFLQFLYRASGGSSTFAVLLTPAGGGAWGGDTSEMEIRYARVQYDRLRSINTDTGIPGSGPGKPPTSWQSVQGTPLVSMPFVEGYYERAISLQFIGPMDRRFTLNGTSGDLEGLIWVYQFKLDDGIRKIGPSNRPWVQVIIRDGHWVPRFDIVAASDLPDSGWAWHSNPGALIKSDSKGKTHVLLIRTKPGFWKSMDEMCYFVKAGDDWSAPQILGHNPADTRFGSFRALALDQTGNVFAAWTNRDNRVVGRWILLQK